MARKHDLEAEEGSRLWRLGSIRSTTGAVSCRHPAIKSAACSWALNNHDTLQREADERGLTSDDWNGRRWKMLDKQLGTVLGLECRRQSLRRRRSQFSPVRSLKAETE